MTKTPILLLILDGWGIESDPSPRAQEADAIAQAHPVHYLSLLQNYPYIPIKTSGNAVGLPEGQMGNSEVGHLTMGSGRILYQELTRIDNSIQNGEFFKNPVFLQAADHVKNSGKTLHIMGLVSDGQVHSSMNHLFALIDFAKQQGLEKVRVHAFLDGRDVLPKSAEAFLQQVEEKLDAEGFSQIATISGRYYAMDRDKRWERTEKAYDNLTLASGRKYPLSLAALQKAYQLDQTDEFVEPCVTDLTYEGMQDGDSIIFFNFRPDRARQLTRAFFDPDFDGFPRKKVLKDLYFACMTMYDETYPLPIAFPKQKLTHILAEILSEHGMRQFRTAETEKYAHVTFFFNGGFEKVYPGEDRKMIPSPKVATYDLKPEMNISAVCDEVVQAVQGGQYAFIVANFANPDMVGHTGNMTASIDAVKAVDEALGRVVDAILKADGVLLLTADHGNVEKMLDEHGNVFTAHTTNNVPLIMVSNNPALLLRQDQTYGLSNIAPTILELMGLPIPAEMTSPSVLVRKSPETSNIQSSQSAATPATSTALS